MSVDNTWIKLYRKIIDSDVFYDEKAFQLLVWLLVSVDYQTGSIKVGRFWLADILKSNPNTIRDVIKRLDKKYKIITTSHTNKYTEITLLNWSKYQARIFPTPQDDTNKTPTKHQQNTTNQEYKNIEVKNNTLGSQANQENIGKETSKKRKDINYPKALLNELANYYADRKGIKPQGNEWLPIQQAIKTILMNGRTDQDIKDFIFWLSTNWLHWDINTVRTRMPEFISGAIKGDASKVNPIVNDPTFKRYQEIYGRGDDWAVRAKMDLLPRLESKYPAYRFDKEWVEAKNMLKEIPKIDENNRFNEFKNLLVN